MSELNENARPRVTVQHFATNDEQTIKRLRAQLAAMKKQRDEARLDAERYRWLKSAGCYWVDIRSQPHGALIFQGHASHDYSGNCEMDDAIDRAIATQKEGGGA